MNFNTVEFVVFLPLACMGYWLLSKKARTVFLLLASWLFYGVFQPKAIFLLMGETAFTWLCAKNMTQENKKTILALCMAVVIGVFALCKYTGVFLAAIGFGDISGLLLPAGISFYSFQMLGYVIDVYRGDIEAGQGFVDYALFVSFFPQLVAGPIERSRNLLRQLKKEKRFDRQYLAEGMEIMLRGYFKKIVIADGLAMFVDRVYGNASEAVGLEIVVATILFGIQILCDFGGYSDIAKGSAKMLGIDLMENFRHPYDATSVRDFWRRWHVSLSSWFSDYVYIPLGGSHSHHIRNIWVVFLLSGIWHGAGLTFIAWGAIHALYMTLESHGIGNRFTALAGIMFGWLFFRATSMADAMALIQRMIVGWNVFPYTLMEATKIILMVLAWYLIDHCEDKTSPIVKFYLLLGILVGGIVLLQSGGQNAFIYFQF